MIGRFFKRLLKRLGFQSDRDRWDAGAKWARYSLDSGFIGPHGLKAIAQAGLDFEPGNPFDTAVRDVALDAIRDQRGSGCAA